MTATTIRKLSLVVGCAWLVVAGCGLRWAAVDAGDDWEPPYQVFSLALLLGAALTVFVTVRVTRPSPRPRLRLAGLVISGLGVVATIVAWALPLWMTLLGVGLALLAVASGSVERRAIVLLAAGPLLGLAVMFGGIAAKIGRRDEWGDYPAASGIGVAVAAAITIVGLLVLTRNLERRPAIAADAAPGVRATPASGPSDAEVRTLPAVDGALPGVGGRG